MTKDEKIVVAIQRSTKALLAALAALAPNNFSYRQILEVQKAYQQRKPTPEGESDG